MRSTIVNDSVPMAGERRPIPLYHQIYMVLREKILNGDYAYASLLPSEMETVRQFGVSRITAKRALNDLASDGLVERMRGHGTRVIYRPSTPPVRANVEGMLENLLAMGLETSISLLEFEYISPNHRVAKALNCSSEDSVQRAVRIRKLDGEPFSYLTTYVPLTIGKSYNRDDLATKPLLTLLERNGVVVSSAEQTISATMADATIGLALGVELGAPLLRIDRIVYDQQGQPVEFINALYRPDRYKYSMTLSRVETDHTMTWSPTP